MAQFTWYQQDNHRKHDDITTIIPGTGGYAVPLCSTTDVQLRFLCPEDLEEVRTLCQDWFPINYPLSWYIDITSSTRFFALAAVYNFTIIGLIVAEIKPYTRLNKEDKEILPDSMGKDIDVGYILSLGVHKKHRRNGIGSLLLDALLKHLTTLERLKVKAIFLHVLTTNQAAILFYENRGFRMHSFLPYYYSIRGNCKDGFTYVSYINGGHPPWTLIDYVKNWCSSLRRTGDVCTWFGNRIVGMFRWLRHRTVSRFNFAH